MHTMATTQPNTPIVKRSRPKKQTTLTPLEKFLKRLPEDRRWVHPDPRFRGIRYVRSKNVPKTDSNYVYGVVYNAKIQRRSKWRQIVNDTSSSKAERERAQKLMDEDCVRRDKLVKLRLRHAEITAWIQEHTMYQHLKDNEKRKKIVARHVKSADQDPNKFLKMELAVLFDEWNHHTKNGSNAEPYLVARIDLLHNLLQLDELSKEEEDFTKETMEKVPSDCPVEVPKKKRPGYSDCNRLFSKENLERLYDKLGGTTVDNGNTESVQRLLNDPLLAAAARTGVDVTACNDNAVEDVREIVRDFAVDYKKIMNLWQYPQLEKCHAFKEGFVV